MLFKSKKRIGKLFNQFFGKCFYSKIGKYTFLFSFKGNKIQREKFPVQEAISPMLYNQLFESKSQNCRKTLIT